MFLENDSVSKIINNQLIQDDQLIFQQEISSPTRLNIKGCKKNNQSLQTKNHIIKVDPIEKYSIFQRKNINPQQKVEQHIKQKQEKKQKNFRMKKQSSDNQNQNQEELTYQDTNQFAFCVNSQYQQDYLQGENIFQQQNHIQRQLKEIDQKQESSQEDQINQLYNYNSNFKKAFFKAENFQTLISAKLPNKFNIKCILQISSNKSLLLSETVYHLYLKEQKKRIMTAKKFKFKLNSFFQIVQTVTNQSVKLLGELSSNFRGTEWVLNRIKYNESEIQTQLSVEMKSIQHQRQAKQKIQMCYVMFQANILGLFGYRSAKILKKKGKKLPKTQRFSQLKSAYDNKKYSDVELITTRMPNKNSQGHFELNLNPEIRTYSNKNIILENQQGQTSLIFGKITQGIYSLHVYQPFSLLQAFAFAISNLDAKIMVT